MRKYNEEEFNRTWNQWTEELEEAFWYTFADLVTEPNHKITKNENNSMNKEMKRILSIVKNEIKSYAKKY